MDKPKDSYHITLKPSGNRIQVEAGTLLPDAKATCIRCGNGGFHDHRGYLNHQR